MEEEVGNALWMECFQDVAIVSHESTQGCQIFLGTTYQNWKKYTKWQ
jgi:hypothetical protein